MIYTGLNAADTVEGAENKNHTNGTPLSILITENYTAMVILDHLIAHYGYQAIMKSVAQIE